jgi:hypothetical protein
MCKEEGKECVKVTEQREIALLKFHVKCSICGKLLVS